MTPPRNRGKSSENPRCPECGEHYKDINRHVERIHNTTLSNLKQRKRSYQNVQYQEYQDNRTRQERRNYRLFSRSQLIKKIDGYLRILHSQKRNASKEDELIFDLEDVKNKLELLKQKDDADLNDADLDLNSDEN
ncbi:39169_t:CDS:2 [Gigaspora margarita]|uniref:39169_t:CDS:1 n=1 Tax=Gigaspora margarita TaxID=4874 RepID=A0ABM8VZG2_GIGMA|nr:39169_t:CDS:2 [Gigaspora margarita]